MLLKGHKKIRSPPQHATGGYLGRIYPERGSAQTSLLGGRGRHFKLYMVMHGICFGISLFCMVLHRLHGVVQLIWHAGELPHSASCHFSMQLLEYQIPAPPPPAARHKKRHMQYLGNREWYHRSTGVKTNGNKFRIKNK